MLKLQVVRHGEADDKRIYVEVQQCLSRIAWTWRSPGECYCLRDSLGGRAMETIKAD